MNRIPQKRKFICLALLLCSCCMSSMSQAGDSSGGFLDFNLYPYLSDVDTDNVLTINIAAKLENRFSYFSLTNFGNQDNSEELSDLNTFYTEQNIRWKTSDTSPLDLTLQMNFRTGEDNDRHRLGVRWRMSDTEAISSLFKYLNMSYSINFHLVQFDSEDADVRQLEHVFKFKFPYLTDRLYLAGFVDHTFNQDLKTGFPNNPIVGEAQLGFRLIEKLFLVTEYRINEYRRSDVNNLAIGIEYKVTW